MTWLVISGAFSVCNDPDFIWTTTPYYNKEEGLPSQDFEDAFRTDPRTGWELIQAAKKKGYRPKLHGSFEIWLWDYLGKIVETVTPVDDGDAFPHCNEVEGIRTNYSRSDLRYSDRELIRQLEDIKQ